MLQAGTTPALAGTLAHAHTVELGGGGLGTLLAAPALPLSPLCDIPEIHVRPAMTAGCACHASLLRR